jgi:hypothetical protein
MMMTPRLRKLVLTAHIASSVGFLGAAATFLALAVTGLMSRDEQIMRTAYLGMALATWSVIVPLSLASLLIGLVHSLGTPWGLFRHYWVLVKLLLTLLCAIALLVHTRPIDYLASEAAREGFSNADLRGVRIQLVVAAGLALLALLAATALSVYKPPGMTQYGWRKLRWARDLSEQLRQTRRKGSPPPTE